MDESAEQPTSLEALSALADGELDDAESACSIWRSDPAARLSWHAYHLIGDVLRSADLASDADRDAAFLERVRAHLRESVALPVESIIVPGPTAPWVETRLGPARRPAARAATRMPAGVMRRRAWIGSAAVAAGFVIVAGGVVLTRSPTSSAPVDATIAQATSLAPGAAGEAADVPDVMPLVADGRLIRDARLDRYLAAHKQFAGSSALGLPSAFVYSAATDRPSR